MYSLEVVLYLKRRVYCNPLRNQVHIGNIIKSHDITDFLVYMRFIAGGVAGEGYTYLKSAMWWSGMILSMLHPNKIDACMD